MKEIEEYLFSLSEPKYAEFCFKLAPTVARECFIGVRIPILRKYATELFNKGTYKEFLDELPHKYYEENLLHGFLISKIKDYQEVISQLNKFLPYIDNWAVCDTTRPSVFKKHKEELLLETKKQLKSDHAYTVRFAINTLMSNYLDEDFNKENLYLMDDIKLDDYYVKMMIAFYLATALAKRWDDTIEYLAKSKISDWTFNKTIQKALESYRLTNEKKIYLKMLKSNKNISSI